ncbi:hypothetical protein ACFTZ8_34170 [Streptomyces fungicidicus]
MGPQLVVRRHLLPHLPATVARIDADMRTTGPARAAGHVGATS